MRHGKVRGEAEKGDCLHWLLQLFLLESINGNIRYMIAADGRCCG